MGVCVCVGLGVGRCGEPGNMKEENICRISFQKLRILFKQWRKENWQSSPDWLDLSQIKLALLQKCYCTSRSDPDSLNWPLCRSWGTRLTISSGTVSISCRKAVCFSAGVEFWTFLLKVHEQNKSVVCCWLACRPPGASGRFYLTRTAIRTSRPGALQSFNSSLSSHSSLFFL